MGTYQAISFFEFRETFSSEDVCKEKLFEMKWPDGFTCPRCGNESHYIHKNRGLYQCKSCGYQASLTSGTIMHKTRISLVKWFWIIYMMGTDKRGISTLEISKKLELRYATAWLMVHKVRTAMKNRDDQYKLTGLIEIDETFIGKSSTGKRGRGSEKIPVVVSVSTSGEKMLFAKMKVVESVTKQEIMTIIEKTIPPGQSIKTDGLKVYEKLTEEININHERVVISRSSLKAHDLLKWVHIIAGNAKAWINGTFHGIDRKHLQLYLDEFCYRLNRRFFETQIFDRLLKACIDSKTITYSELIG